MKKGIRITLIIILMTIIGTGSYFISKEVTESYLKDNKTIKDINLETFVTDFNKNLKESNMDLELIIDEDVVANENKTYWINIQEGIDIAVLMDKITENKNKDVVRVTGLAFKTDYEDKEKIESYLKVLLKTNNPKLSDEDINKMIKNANNMNNSTEKDGNKTSKTFEYKGLGIDQNSNLESTIYRIARYNKY
ncbi:MAG: hypothetical protein E7166_03325 [Firmicutes bacterium]|nr:hypothetical protein [Bacillota bacterium]